MFRELFRFTLAALITLLIGCFLYTHPSYSQQNLTKSKSVIMREIDKIKNEPPSPRGRTDHTEQLSQLIYDMDPNTIDSADIDALAGMMSDKDDSVRYWIAMSLGYIGPSAMRAVPALEKALKEIDCSTAEKTSESGIRLALKRIGVTPPATTCNH